MKKQSELKRGQMVKGIAGCPCGSNEFKIQDKRGDYAGMEDNVSIPGYNAKCTSCGNRIVYFDNEKAQLMTVIDISDDEEENNMEKKNKKLVTEDMEDADEKLKKVKDKVVND